MNIMNSARYLKDGKVCFKFFLHAVKLFLSDKQWICNDKKKKLTEIIFFRLDLSFTLEAIIGSNNAQLVKELQIFLV